MNTPQTPRKLLDTVRAVPLYCWAVVGFLAILIGLGAYHFWLTFLTEKVMQEHGRAGYPISLEQANALYSQEPDTQQPNAFDLYLQALKAYEQAWKGRDEEKTSAGLASSDFKHRFVDTENLQLSQRERQDQIRLRGLIAKAYAKNAKAFELIEQASRLPYCRFPAHFSLDDESGWEDSNGVYLGALLWVLENRFTMNYLKEQYDECYQVLLLIYDTATKIRERVPQNHFQSKLCHWTFSQLLCCLVTVKSLDSEQIGRLQKTIDIEKERSSLRLQLAMDLLYDSEESWPQAMERLRNTPFMKMSSAEWTQLRCEDFAMELLGQERRDRYETAKAMTRLCRRNDLDEVVIVKEMSRLSSKLRRPEYSWCNSDAAANAAWSIVRLKMLKVMLAIEQYQLKCGHLPESLDELIPDYVTEIPKNPKTLQKLTYKQLGPKSYSLSVPGAHISKAIVINRNPPKRVRPAKTGPSKWSCKPISF